MTQAHPHFNRTFPVTAMEPEPERRPTTIRKPAVHALHLFLDEANLKSSLTKTWLEEMEMESAPNRESYNTVYHTICWQVLVKRRNELGGLTLR